MSTENLTNSILNFDVFKCNYKVKDVPIPDYAQKFLTKLQASIHRIQNETLQKYISPSDVVPKVMNDLERSLNTIMKRNLLVVQSISNQSKISMSDLYSQAIRRNNATLKKHLESIYLTCRVYRELFKDHPVLENLQQRLISVRCKAIRDICQNETRRGKIRHLRCGSRNPRLVPTVPRRLKTLLKRIHREIEKTVVSDKEESGPMYGVIEDAIANYYHRHSDGSEVEENALSLSSAEIAWNLAKLAGDNGDARGQSYRYDKGLLSDRANSVLLACEHEGVLDVLGISSDEVARSFASGECLSQLASLMDDRQDRDPLGIVAMESVIEDYDEYVAGVAEDVNGTVSGIGDDRIGEDILDFDNFQLVDVWEEHEQQQQQLPGEGTTGMLTESTTATPVEPQTVSIKSGPPARKKRRSRFAPMTDEELAVFLLQQHEQLEQQREYEGVRAGHQSGHRPGFCSTFVDEDVPVRREDPPITPREKASESTEDLSASMRPVKQESSPVSDALISMPPGPEAASAVLPVPGKVNRDTSPPLGAVPASSPRQQPQQHEPEENRDDAVLDRGNLCKVILRQFHDSLLQLATATSNKVSAGVATGRGNNARGNNRRRERNSLVETVLAPWRAAGTAMRPCEDSRVPGDSSDMVARQIYREVEARMAELAGARIAKKRRGYSPGNSVVAKKEARSTGVVTSTSSTGNRKDAHDSYKKRSTVAMATELGKKDQQEQERHRHQQHGGTSEDNEDVGLAKSTDTGSGKTGSSNGVGAGHNSRKPSRSSETSAPAMGSASPERARLRAMMLSYKRDVEKSREGASSTSAVMATGAGVVGVSDDDTSGPDQSLALSSLDPNSACSAASVASGAMAVSMATTKVEPVQSQDKSSSGTGGGGGGAVDDECGMAELLSRASSDQVWTGADEHDPATDRAFRDDSDNDSEGLASSSSENGDCESLSAAVRNKQHPRQQAHSDCPPGQPRGPPSGMGSRTTTTATAAATTTTTSTNKAEISRMQWLVPPPEAVSVPTIPAPATPFLEDSEEQQCWTGRKVFVVDSHDKGSAMALAVKAFLHKNNARVYDTTNYKQAGKDLHVLVHQDWRFPDSGARAESSGASGGAGGGSLSSAPISLLLLKNNSGVHFLSYADAECVSNFSCQTVFPHSRSCIFLDQHALLGTHADNIRNMLDFMIHERQTSNRVWCLKIPGSVYRLFCSKIAEKSALEDCGDEESGVAELENLRRIQSVLVEYSSKYSKEDSLCLVEIQSGDEDITSQQEHVLNQQHYLQKKFRHFCILTDSLNATELDIGFLSIYGVAVLPLNTFLLNKTGKYIKKTTPLP